jgi:hypothetical protein
VDAGAITAIFSRRRFVSFDESAGQRHGTAMNDDILPDNPLGLQNIAKLSKTMNTLRVHRAKAVVEVAAGRHLSEIIDHTDDPIFQNAVLLLSVFLRLRPPSAHLRRRSHARTDIGVLSCLKSRVSTSAMVATYGWI